MKIHALILWCVIIAGCNSSNEKRTVVDRTELKSTDPYENPNFIPVDTANRMLQSYLNSINYSDNDTDLQSLIIDVAQLRKYIDSVPDAAAISHVKLMFAHTQQYMNNGHINAMAGYRSGGLTLIIAAYDAEGNYIYAPSNMVLDYTSPCPPVCPPGNAGSPLLSN